MGIDAQMLVKTEKPLSKLEVLNLAHELYGAFGGQGLFVHHGEFGTPCHCLEIVDEFLQDGENIYPEGKQLIQVNLFCRYYGEGYERGPIHLIVLIAEWLEHNIPEAQVFYGGDSSGVCASPFDKKSREKLLKHFFNVGRKPYIGFSLLDKDPPLCKFCGGKPMLDVGGGGGKTFWQCYGCETKMITDGNRKVAEWTDKTDFFEKVKELT